MAFNGAIQRRLRDFSNPSFRPGGAGTSATGQNPIPNVPGPTTPGTVNNPTPPTTPHTRAADPSVGVGTAQNPWKPRAGFVPPRSSQGDHVVYDQVYENGMWTNRPLYTETVDGIRRALSENVNAGYNWNGSSWTPGGNTPEYQSAIQRILGANAPQQQAVQPQTQTPAQPSAIQRLLQSGKFFGGFGGGAFR